MSGKPQRKPEDRKTKAVKAKAAQLMGRAEGKSKDGKPPKQLATGQLPGDLMPTASLSKGDNPKPLLELRATAKRLGVDPFQVMLLFAGNKHAELGYEEGAISKELRFVAAKEATKYLFPQLKSIEVSGPDGQPVSVERKIESASRIVELLERLVNGKTDISNYLRPGVVDGKAVAVTDVEEPDNTGEAEAA